MTIFSVPANLAFDSYSGLISAIDSWMDREDLTGVAPHMIALAEARMRRRFRAYFNETTTTLTTVSGVIALPTDCAEVVRIIYDHDTVPRYSALNVSDMDYDTSATQPFAYTIEAGGIRLWPAVDVTITVIYQQTFPALSEDVPSNTFLDQHPDMYFFGSMLFAEGYVANDNRAGMFKGLFDEALAEVDAYLQSQRWTGPLAPRLRREF
jgi:hypothetical protein